VIIDPKDVSLEQRKELFGKKAVIASVLEDRPSGFTDEDVLNWDQFIAAWLLDRAPGSMDDRLMAALKVFILTWKLEGKGGYKVPIRMRNPKNPEEEIEIECQTEQLPDITYNPDGVTDIGDLDLPYRLWMDAVADLKFNLAGSSHGEEATKYEHLHWGGPVDITQDVRAADIDPDDPISKVFDL
jgi:hypothetical protein